MGSTAANELYGKFLDELKTQYQADKVKGKVNMKGGVFFLI